MSKSWCRRSATASPTTNGRPASPMRTAGQQLAAGDQLGEDPADQPEAHRHGTAQRQQSQPGPDAGGAAR